MKDFTLRMNNLVLVSATRDAVTTDPHDFVHELVHSLAISFSYDTVSSLSTLFIIWNEEAAIKSHSKCFFFFTAPHGRFCQV